MICNLHLKHTLEDLQQEPRGPAEAVSRLTRAAVCRVKVNAVDVYM